jgi:beta-glucosidase
VALENFSATYDGILTAPQDETLFLRIGADDRIRVIVNGDTLVNILRGRQRV